MSSAPVLVENWPTVAITKTMPLVTSRQRQVLLLASIGMSYKEIAFDLGISLGGVKCHAFQLTARMRKFGFKVNNITAAVALALRQGWIE